MISCVVASSSVQMYVYSHIVVMVITQSHMKLYTACKVE